MSVLSTGTWCRLHPQPFTDETVMALVDTTAAAIEKNASDTFRRINAGMVLTGIQRTRRSMSLSMI